jgi:hypothetical protein
VKSLTVTYCNTGANLLIINYDDLGIATYMVCNNQGLCLIRTTSSRIALYVERHVKYAHPELRLMVGGDPGSRTTKLIWRHIRKFSK